LIALKILFDRIDQELIPLPTQYITVKEKKDLKAKSGTQAKKTNEGNIGSEG
jgi:hypothetical protein